jgi:hypothetical protein
VDSIELLLKVPDTANDRQSSGSPSDPEWIQTMMELHCT